MAVEYISDFLQGSSLFIYSGSYKSWKSWRLRTPVERQPDSPDRFNRRMIETQETEGDWNRGKNLSYLWMTLKPCGRAWLQRHPRPVVRSLQGYDVLFGPRPSDSIHLSEEPTRSVIAYPDEDRTPAVIPTVLISSPENAYLIIPRLPFEKSSLGL